MASDPPIAIPTEVTKETTTTTAPTDPLHAQAQSATTASASTHDSTPTPSAPEAQAAAVVAVAAVAAAAAADATPAEPIQPGSVNQPEVSQSALPSVVESGQAVPAPVEPAPTSHAAAVEDAPDPDEDDLDDLDGEMTARERVLRCALLTLYHRRPRPVHRHETLHFRCSTIYIPARSSQCSLAVQPALPLGDLPSPRCISKRGLRRNRSRHTTR